MFIQTEETPNPATLKFLPGRDVLPGETRDFRNADEAGVSPLASRIFAIDGVSGVFLGQDFVTVTRDAAEEEGEEEIDHEKHPSTYLPRKQIAGKKLLGIGCAA